MSHVSEKIRYEFESVPIGLKYHILEKNIRLNSHDDLVGALNSVLQEEDEENELLPVMKRLARETLGRLNPQHGQPPIAGIH
ncbi:MAG TPA: hypothetical protein GX011_02685 [Clostridiales bacterium]|jgi:hypothetical protein|nr:hypothetical protein [Clostridiales bacterium]